MKTTGMAKVRHFIDGKLTAGDGERRQDIYNPATGELTAQVALGGKTEVDVAVRAASGAAPGWAETAPHKRARILSKFKELIEQHHDDLAAVITREHGKVLSDARGEV